MSQKDNVADPLDPDNGFPDPGSGQDLRKIGDNRKSGWLLLIILILVVLLGVAGYNIYRSYQYGQALATLAENSYQRDFHDLSQHMNEITGQLAQVLSCASREQLALSLSALWRQSFAAQANLGGLPLTLVSLNQTEKFLADTADSVHYLLWRTAREGDALKQDEQTYVLKLLERAQLLSESLEKISYQVVREDLRLVELQQSLWSGTEMKDNSVLDGLDMLETQLADYPEQNLTRDLEPLVGREDNTPGPPHLPGKDLPTQGIDGRGSEPVVSQEEAIEIALEFWLGQGNAGFQGRVAYESVGDLPTYGIELSGMGSTQGIANVDVVQKDGKVLWAMSVPRFDQTKPVLAQSIKEITPEPLDGKNPGVTDWNGQEPLLAQGSRRCLEFLADRKFPAVVLAHSQTNENYGIYTFVPLQEGVRLYPDQIKMQVDLSDMTITGYEGSPFYRHHRQRDLPPITVTRSKILTLVSPFLQIESAQLALIENDWNQEILTWEVRAGINKEKFALYYDTENAVEEKILRLTPAAMHLQPADLGTTLP